ncbi:serine protease [Streptomyces sp. NPDC006627]|uniref:serine protease n=1 Tax=Streptomyces sp. NPDC006627 TaxID=3154679 RepID=UPI0033A1E584
MLATEAARAEMHRQAAEAAQRYRETTAEREEIEEKLAEGVRFPDAPGALAARAERILDRGGLSPSAVVSSIHAEALDLPEANERIINLSNELQAWSFLPRGVRAGNTVARITLRRNGRELPHGTGFMVSPRLLMTNHHVLPNAEFARRCFAEFNAQVSIDNAPDTVARMELDPAAFFTADERLDFALVAVAPAADGRLAGEIFGLNRLSVQLGKLVIGERVNIIGHPNGRLKEIALRDNALLLRLDDFLHYKTDTEPGNSGSPVFNDQWEVVALHHSGVPNKDEQGRVLRKDGRPWQRGDGDDAIDWIANEGVRISAILKHLAGLRLDPRQHALLTELGPDSGLTQSVPAGQAVTGPPPPTPQGTGLPETAAPKAVAPVGTAPTGATGRRGRNIGSVDGTERHLVFLHGRRQHGKDPEALRRSWTAGLNHGLTRAGMATVHPGDVWFPYYGERLAALMGYAESAGGAVDLGGLTAEEAAERFAAESPRGSYERLLDEAARRAGMPRHGSAATEGIDERLVGTLRRPLRWLAARSAVDEWTIAAVFRDVDRYLGDRDVREAVLECVLTTLPTSGELVLVTHSLGTVVGMDLITRLPDGLDVTLLVTAAGPLGMDAVSTRLLTAGPRRPERVRHWVNVWCPTDAVAIGCPLAETGWGRLTQLAVTNCSDCAHDIEEYLTHADVAAEIGGALGGHARPEATAGRAGGGDRVC